MTEIKEYYVTLFKLYTEEGSAGVVPKIACPANALNVGATLTVEVNRACIFVGNLVHGCILIPLIAACSVPGNLKLGI